MSRLVGIGSALLDVVARVEEGFLAQEKIPKGAMMMMEAHEIKRLMGKVEVEKKLSGGSASNTLAAAALLGTDCGFTGALCDDAAGRSFLADLKVLKVKAHVPPKEKGLPSGLCLILVTRDGERSMPVFLGASQTLTQQDILEADMKDAEVSFMEAYLWDWKDGLGVAEKAARLTKKHGGKVALTLSDPLCIGRHRDSVRAFIEKSVDILIGNEKEALALCERRDLEGALERIENLAELAVITQSEKGAILLEKGARSPIAAKPVQNLLDSTGAGDAFAGGFFHGLLKGEKPADAAEIGAGLAAKILTQFGARFSS